jgi:hypothetical protein
MMLFSAAENSMSQLPKIGILLPTKNDAGFIGSTLLALFVEIGEYQAAGGQIEMGCINDGSTDETGELLSRHLASCPCEYHLVDRKENRGVPYSLEEGRAQLGKDCRAYLRCDADARFLRSGWLREMVRFLFSDPGTGVISPVIIKPRGFIDNFGISFFPNGETWNEWGHHYRPEVHGEIREVDATFGVYSLMRAEDWTIDTGYHLWVEDEDQGLELRRRGKKNFVMGYLPVVHYQDFRPSRNGVAPEPGQDFRSAHPVRRESLAYFERKWGFSAISPDMAEVRRRYAGTELLWQENEKSRQAGAEIIRAFEAAAEGEGAKIALVRALTENRKALAQAEADLEITRTDKETRYRQFEAVRGKLEEAYLTIAKQQDTVQRLTRKIASRRGGDEASSAQEAAGPNFSISSAREPEAISSPLPMLHESALTRPDNIFRKLGVDKSAPADQAPEPARRLVLSAEVRARVEPLWKKCPAWVDGAVRLEDACFLELMIEAERPDHFYEIGVASGVSTSIILAALSRYAHTDVHWLHSYDLIEVCFFNNAYPIGGAVPEMTPDLVRHWQMNLRTTAIDIPTGKKETGQCMYFIDAMHSHPWPVLDLIALLPRLVAGDCVILHDINLPEFSGGQFPHYGAQWLFDHWTGPRVVPDQTLPNIGAIIMPEDWSTVLPALWQTLLRPWNPEIAVSQEHLMVCEKRLLQFLRQNNLLHS